MITVLAGGVGAARFLRGLVLAVDPSLVTAVVNTGDDTELHGLSISPDIDTVTYTVAGAIDPDRGWGLAEESWIAMENLARYAAVRPVGSGAAPDWFNLGDRDLATHFYRTARLTEGATLSEVTDEIARAWGLDVRVVPMTDDRVRTMVDIVDNGVVTTVGFQEYFVKRRHAVPVTGIRFDGAEHARPTFVDTINSSEVVIIAPSNPLVSIGPIRALDGVDRALTANRERVAAISPIVAGSALKGPADRMLTELGFEASVVGVARLYAPVCATLVIDERDADRRTEVEDCGVRCVVTDTIMRTPEVTRALADITLTAAREGAPHGR
ncbi:MAG: 2-phospho-L-lactate transferase [Ilumatobacteraceae bacterium]|nr:2-phospho-L-lactate transferase [Ilumatobacteraceae bacterium]